MEHVQTKAFRVSSLISLHLTLKCARFIPDCLCHLTSLEQELGLGMMAALCTGVQLNLIAEPFVAFSKAI